MSAIRYYFTGLILLALSALSVAEISSSHDCNKLDSAVLNHAKVVRTESGDFCKVEAKIWPKGYSQDRHSFIGLELWLPAPESWNGRLVAVGNGGYSPKAPYQKMSELVSGGYAVVATDTGHQTETLDFVVGYPERIDYWGHLAVHEMATQASILVQYFYGKPADYRYFQGCSTGGHQALMSAQRYPDDFDGIIAGAPGNNRIALNASFLWQFVSNHSDNNSQIIADSSLPMIMDNAIKQCDRLDGLQDNIITDPRQCHVNLEPLKCKTKQTSPCLDSMQIEALKKMYRGATSTRNHSRIYPGFPPGSEAIAGYGWAPYWADQQLRDQPARLDFWRYWVFEDANWHWQDFDWHKDLEYAHDKLANKIDATDPDLSAFAKSNGRLILYHGWADPVVSAYDTINHFEKITLHTGNQFPTEDFARLYLLPGVAHCQGGEGADTVDMLRAIERWVEKNQPPLQLVAEKKDGNDVLFRRPLCPYPQLPFYDGKGDPSKSASFICREGPEQYSQ